MALLEAATLMAASAAFARAGGASTWPAAGLLTAPPSLLLSCGQDVQRTNQLSQISKPTFRSPICQYAKGTELSDKETAARLAAGHLLINLKLACMRSVVLERVLLEPEPEAPLLRSPLGQSLLLVAGLGGVGGGVAGSGYSQRFQSSAQRPTKL